MFNRTFLAIAAFASIAFLCGGAVYIYKENAERGGSKASSESTSADSQKDSGVQAKESERKSIKRTNVSAIGESERTTGAAEKLLADRVHSKSGNSITSVSSEDSNRVSDVEKFLLKAQKDGTHQAVYGDGARALLSSEKFGEVIEGFRQKSLNDSTVAELNEVYRSAIADQLAGMESSAKLTGFACSVEMCVGEISGGQDPSFWANWLKKFTEDRRTPMWTMMQGDFVDAYGNPGHRFIISIDPNINAVQIPNP